MNKIVLLGEAPRPSGSPDDQPFADATGERLRRYLGWSEEWWNAWVLPVNLLQEPPGRDGKGAGFDLDAARAAWARLHPTIGGAGILLAGHRVARAVGVHGRYFETLDGRFVILPHPSGINKWWNDEENRQRALAAGEAIRYLVEQGRF